MTDNFMLTDNLYRAFVFVPSTFTHYCRLGSHGSAPSLVEMNSFLGVLVWADARLDSCVNSVDLKGERRIR